MRLFGHQSRSTLPSLNPITVNCPKNEKASNVKEDYNQNSRTLPALQPGTIVRMRLPGDKRWDQIGKVIKNVQNHVRMSYLTLWQPNCFVRHLK